MCCEPLSEYASLGPKTDHEILTHQTDPDLVHLDAIFCHHDTLCEICVGQIQTRVTCARLLRSSVPRRATGVATPENKV